MRLFLDTSALAKRYVQERNSERVLEYCSKADEIYISILAPVELLSAMNRSLREGRVTRKDYSSIKKEFALDVEGVTVVDLSSLVVRHAIKCLERSVLRSLDAIQVASAITVGADVILTADKHQAKAAKQNKMAVVLV